MVEGGELEDKLRNYIYSLQTEEGVWFNADEDFSVAYEAKKQMDYGIMNE